MSQKSEYRLKPRDGYFFDGEREQLFYLYLSLLFHTIIVFSCKMCVCVCLRVLEPTLKKGLNRRIQI